MNVNYIQHECVWLLFLVCNQTSTGRFHSAVSEGVCSRWGEERTDLIGWKRGRAHRVVWLLRDCMFVYVEAVSCLLFPPYLCSFYSVPTGAYEKGGVGGGKKKKAASVSFTLEAGSVRRFDKGMQKMYMCT